jgi:hypothetical protein
LVHSFAYWFYWKFPSDSVGEALGEPLDPAIIKPLAGDESLPKFSPFDLPYALQHNTLHNNNHNNRQMTTLTKDDEVRMKLSVERAASERNARETELSEMERMAEVARKSWESVCDCNGGLFCCFVVLFVGFCCFDYLVLFVCLFDLLMPRNLAATPSASSWTRRSATNWRLKV